MDTPAHYFRATVSNSSSIQSHRQNLSHNSIGSNRNNHQYTQRRLHQRSTKIPPQPSVRSPHTFTTNQFKSPRLLQLVSKFEALDADSLAFNIRAAQPPHLRLPGSRMGRRGQESDLQQMKTTRGKLLTQFDRPGWGAGTLRGFQDGNSSMKSDDNLRRDGRGLAIKTAQDTLNSTKSPSGKNNDVKGTPHIRPRLRRESLIAERVRLFDNGRACLPSGYNYMERLNGIDRAIPSQSPTKNQSTVSAIKPGSYSVFPPEYHTQTLTPVRSYGYLRPKEIRPLPWRPLDSRRWEMVARQINSPSASSIKGRLRDQARHHLITPTPANTASALKRVQITYQDPKRNVSEKVNVLYATISDECEKQIKYQLQDKYCSSHSDPFVTDTSSLKGSKKNGLGDKSFGSIAAAWHNIGFKSAERLKAAKESRIQDRINLFNNEMSNIDSVIVPRTRMRNQSTPTKLPSQIAYKALHNASDKHPLRSQSIRSRASESSTGDIPVTSSDSIAPSVESVTIANEPCLKPQVQEPAGQGPALRKLSGISDKIQLFESFRAGNSSNIGNFFIDSNRGLSLSLSKRNQTWPLPSSGFTLKCKIEQKTTIKKSVEQNRKGHETESIKYAAVSDIIPIKNTKMGKAFEYDERAKQKILSRQEHLNQKSGSRSRSRVSISRPTHQGEQTSKAVCQAEQRDARVEKTMENEAETEQQSTTEQNLCIDTHIHQSHIRDGRVQEIWIDGSEYGSSHDVVVMDTVVAQCELMEPRPMRLAETLRIIKLCRGRFRERSATWRRKVGKSSGKAGSFVA